MISLRDPKPLFDNVKSLIQNKSIQVSVTRSLTTDALHVEMSLDNFHIRKVITHKNIEDDTHEHVIRDMERELQQKVDENNRLTNPLSKRAMTYTKDTFETGPTGFKEEDIKNILLLKSYAKQYAQWEDLQEGIIAGGCFVSMFHKDRINDCDVFFLNDFTNSGKPFLDAMEEVKSDYRANDNIIKVMNSKHHPKVQFIYTKYDSREILINDFDCEHCCVSYDIAADKLFISPKTLRCIKFKLLMPHKGNTIADHRKKKFLERGFKPVESASFGL